MVPWPLRKDIWPVVSPFREKYHFPHKNMKSRGLNRFAKSKVNRIEGQVVELYANLIAKMGTLNSQR